MLRITIEMLPKGDESKAWTMAQGVIANDGTGTEIGGNYIYGLSGQAKRPGHDPGITVSGRLESFARKRHNCWSLLRACLNNGDQELIVRSGEGFTSDADLQ